MEDEPATGIREWLCCPARSKRLVDLAGWRVGKHVNGTVRWLEKSGTREWAMEEARHWISKHAQNQKIHGS